jgi:hypothetical protein
MKVGMNAEAPKKIHRYWIHYRAALDLNVPGESNPEKVLDFEAEIGLERDAPICTFPHIGQVAQYLQRVVGQQREIAPERVSIAIKGWTKLEEEEDAPRVVVPTLALRPN